MEKLTIEQLLAMSHEERLAYLQSLPEEERKAVNIQLFKAKSDKDMQALIDNLNKNKPPTL